MRIKKILIIWWIIIRIFILLAMWINTLEMSGELLLTILSSVAQQESETISSHVKLNRTI